MFPFAPTPFSELRETYVSWILPVPSFSHSRPPVSLQRAHVFGSFVICHFHVDSGLFLRSPPPQPPLLTKDPWKLFPSPQESFTPLIPFFRPPEISTRTFSPVIFFRFLSPPPNVPLLSRHFSQLLSFFFRHFKALSLRPQSSLSHFFLCPPFARPFFAPSGKNFFSACLPPPQLPPPELGPLFQAPDPSCFFSPFSPRLPPPNMIFFSCKNFPIPSPSRKPPLIAPPP